MNNTPANSVANQIYANYSEALQLCDGSGYSKDTLTEVVAKKNIIFRDTIDNLDHLGPEVTRTIMGIGFAFSSKSIRVIDFGGGGGYHYTLARHVLGDHFSIKWNVVETESMCQASSLMADGSLNFFSDVLAAKDNLGYVDLVLASSSLQYCPDPIQYLRSLLSLSAKYIYITRTPFSTLSSDSSITTIQSSLLSHNGPGKLPDGYSDQEVIYPITFVPLNQVEEIIQEKYTIKFKILEEQGNLSFHDNIINSYYGIFCELN